jgi:hypothetical protein
MPLRQFVDGHRFDPEAIRHMGLAFEIVRAALQLEHNDKTSNEVLAKRIIALAQQGERDPGRLAERVLADLRTSPPIG